MWPLLLRVLLIIFCSHLWFGWWLAVDASVQHFRRVSQARRLWGTIYHSNCWPWWMWYKLVDMFLLVWVSPPDLPSFQTWPSSKKHGIIINESSKMRWRMDLSPEWDERGRLDPDLLCLSDILFTNTTDKTARPPFTRPLSPARRFCLFLAGPAIFTCPLSSEIASDSCETSN